MRPHRGLSPLTTLSLLAASLLALAAMAASTGGLPPSRLAVFEGVRWTPWWDSRRAPAAWPAESPTVARAVSWRAAAAGMRWGELALAGAGEAWRLRLILVRLDPARLRFELVAASRDAGTLADWSLDALPAGVALAFNAGQFTGGKPWGWQVQRGKVVQPPGVGVLSMAFCVLGDAGVRFVPAAAIPPIGAGDALEAFQSYPVLLRDDGAIPPQLATPGMGVDLAHRDSRLAIGELRDGSVLVALTRFDAAGEVLGSLPFGPTVPEMAAVMGALGCRQAMMLDGGISAQLAVRDASGALQSWRGWREVPLALVAFPR